MPRRNHQAQRPRRPSPDTLERPAPSTDELAHELVRRGMASPAITAPILSPLPLEHQRTDSP